MDNEGYLTMSTKELQRLEILGRVRERRLTQAHAAAQLGLGVRQVKRLCRALRLDGPAGQPIVSGLPDISTLRRTRHFYFALTFTTSHNIRYVNF